MRIEDPALVPMLAPISGTRILFTDQLLPNVRHFHRLVADCGHVSDAHRIGLGLHVPAIFEEGQDGAELSKLDVVAEIDACSGAPDASKHGRNRKDVAL